MWFGVLKRFFGIFALWRKMKVDRKVTHKPPVFHCVLISPALAYEGDDVLVTIHGLAGKVFVVLKVARGFLLFPVTKRILKGAR
jgi:hypothetical protein